jgi:hemolysin III
MSTNVEHLKQPTPTRIYSLGEEIFHSISHGIGVALSVAGLTLLLVLAVLYGNPAQIISFTIYGVTLIVLYLASTLYHSFQDPRVKQVFKRIDHASIYLLIAGTYTPFLVVAIQGVWGWALLVIIWGLALLGISFKTFFIHRFKKLSVLTYILMGWLCVVALNEMIANIPPGGLIWLAAGGIFYTVGVIFYVMKNVPYTHAVWHLFVLAGSICHFFAVLLYLAPAV